MDEIVYREFGEVFKAYRVEHKNGTHLGDLVQLEDGYYNYFPATKLYGAIPAWLLHELANKLDAINKDWDNEVNRSLNDG